MMSMDLTTDKFKWLRQFLPSRIFVSFSGGKTSAFMCWWFVTYFMPAFPHIEVIFVFANTGAEDIETYLFVERVEKWLGVELIKVEAVFHKGRKGTTHKVVKKAEPTNKLFEEMAKKYGIPGPGYLHCTRELKKQPMHSYIKSIWGKEPYWTALGIRLDESDRMSVNAEKLRYWYPLVSLGTTKEMVNSFWEEQPFNLNLEEHRGNCLTCWKKTDRKLRLVYKETPEVFDLFRGLERNYSNCGSGTGRMLWRKYRTTDELLFEDKIIDDNDTEYKNCQESCEPFQ